MYCISAHLNPSNILYSCKMLCNRTNAFKNISNKNKNVAKKIKKDFEVLFVVCRKIKGSKGETSSVNSSGI